MDEDDTKMLRRQISVVQPGFFQMIAPKLVPFLLILGTVVSSQERVYEPGSDFNLLLLIKIVLLGMLSCYKKPSYTYRFSMILFWFYLKEVVHFNQPDDVEDLENKTAFLRRLWQWHVGINFWQCLKHLLKYRNTLLELLTSNTVKPKIILTQLVQTGLS